MTLSSSTFVQGFDLNISRIWTASQVQTMPMMFPDKLSSSNHVLICTEFSHYSKYGRYVINFRIALPRHIDPGRVIYSSSRSSTSHSRPSLSPHIDSGRLLDAGGKPSTWFPPGRLVELIFHSKRENSMITRVWTRSIMPN